MTVSVPKEIKAHEYRVGLTPAGAAALSVEGAEVWVEKGAGLGCGFEDQDYIRAGAKISENAQEAWAKGDLIIKVKEPVESEFGLMRENQVLYTYLHLAVLPELSKVLMDKNITAIAYETIEGRKGGLPLLKPMSEVAGKMATQIGAAYLQCDHGGRGVLLGGVPGIPRGKVTIIGGGIVGSNACKIAVGMGAEVTILDIDVDRLEYLDDIYGNRITTLKSTEENIYKSVTRSDLVIGAVLIPGAKAPRLVTKEHLKEMPKFSVIVDVAVDQGGCVETCKPTTHDQPTFLVEDVIHYCVANMPGAVARSSTFSLTNATLSYARSIVKHGAVELAKRDAKFAMGVNVYEGRITHQGVAEGLGETYHPLESLIE